MDNNISNKHTAFSFSIENPEDGGRASSETSVTTYQTR
jgi:hypothetical protein